MSESQDLREFRKAFALSQKDFGSLVGLSAKAVSNIETGFRNPSRPVLRLVSLFRSVPKKQALQLIKKVLTESETTTAGAR
jgi:transcriptional regulator with XRE-family HTH domain